MNLGAVLSFTTGDGLVTPDRLAETAATIEEEGFDSIWVFDAIGRGFSLPDPLTALAVAGTATTNAELGTCILQLPLREPVELALRVLTTHAAVGGRLALGVGSGSTEDDFAALGRPFADRHRRLNEMMPLFVDALRSGSAHNDGSLHPWPEAGDGPPVLIGSWAGSKWIPRAAREFDGWIASGAKATLQAARDGIDTFRAAGGQRAVMTNVITDLTAQGEQLAPDGGVDLRCGPAEARERLKMLADLGFDDTVLVVPDHKRSTLAAVRELWTR